MIFSSRGWQFASECGILFLRDEGLAHGRIADGILTGNGKSRDTAVKCICESFPWNFTGVGGNGI